MSIAPGLVEIVREFLAVDRAVRELFGAYRRGELGWKAVDPLIDDHEESPLFRLKERCHGLFRRPGDNERVAGYREVLLDLAVGSLFHEAMKFRENFYQREVYGPRVRELRDQAGPGGTGLFDEFEKIQATVSAALDEGVLETEALLDRTREQVALLLAEHPENGYVARCLIESQQDVERVFKEGLDPLLESVFGSAAQGWERAGWSYLRSGYYGEASRTLAEAMQRGGDAAGLTAAIDCAEGLAAYLRGDYGESIERLGSWVAADPAPRADLVDLAHIAVSKLDRLVSGSDRDETLAAARRLTEQLAARRSA